MECPDCLAHEAGICFRHKMKRCSRCELRLPRSKFGVDKRRNTLKAWCKKCYVVNERERKAADPEGYALKVRLRRVNTLYGLNPDEYEWLMLGATNCEICDVELDNALITEGTHKTRAHIDHCHENGHIRGVLCSRCNMALGQLDDDPARLRVAAKYLEMA